MKPSLLVLLLAACSGTKETAETAVPADADTDTDTDTDSDTDTDTDTDADTEPFTPAYPYDALGPYPVGTYDSELVGSTGVTLNVQVWFPATETGTPVTYDGLWPGAASTDVDADCGSPRPVLLFSHGNAGIRWQSAEIMEWIASHGYVVAAPDHTANTFWDYDAARFEEVIVRRPLDIADTFDWLVGEGTSGTIAGCVDGADGYAVSGHSFGGYTAYAVGGATVNDPGGAGELDLSDSRVWGVFTLAPWDGFGSITDGTKAITVPTACMSGTLDETTPWWQVTSLYDALTVEPRALGELVNAGHYTFAPVSCLTTSGDGCGEQYLDLDVATALVSTSMVAFLESIQTDPAAFEYRGVDDDELIWVDGSR